MVLRETTAKKADAKTRDAPINSSRVASHLTQSVGTKNKMTSHTSELNGTDSIP